MPFNLQSLDSVTATEGGKKEGRVLQKDLTGHWLRLPQLVSYISADFGLLNYVLSAMSWSTDQICSEEHKYSFFFSSEWV